MALTLSLPAIDTKPANPPEIRPAKLFPWLDAQLKRDPIEAAGTIGDSLAAINRVAMSDSRRLEIAERYWAAGDLLWPQLEKAFVRSTHPLTGEALAAAKAALGLASELSVAYKHLLAREADRRIHLTGYRLLVALIHRCLQCTARILINSYLSYSPVPAKTWLDAHAIYAFSRERDQHQSPIAADQPEMTPERVYLQALLLALANPYGFRPGQLDTVVRYLQEFSHWAKLTDVAPVHRMAKAVAIIPGGHDFPPFSANKGGAIEGAKIFLLTYDLAFQIQEQLRKATGMPVTRIRSMEEVAVLSTVRRRLNALLMAIFGGSALLLASIGIYGLMAYSVQQRTQEIGIRIALGAESSQVRNMVVKQGMRLALMGIVAGIAASFGLTRFLESSLYQVKAWDPLVFIGSPLILGAVSFLSVWLPARRATRIDPMIALRHE